MSLFYSTSLSSAKSKIYCAAAITITCSLFFIPYQEIRIERIRSFGENKAVGIVIEKIDRITNNGDKTLATTAEKLIRYQFIDQLGQAQERVANIESNEWNHLAKGDNIVVYYAKAEPRISRIKSENESQLVKTLAKISRTIN